ATREALARGIAASPELADPRSPAAQKLLADSLGQWTDLGTLAVAVVNAAGETVVRAQVKGEGERVAAALRPGMGPGWTGLVVPGASPPVLRFAAPISAGSPGAGSLVLIADGAPLREVVRPEELDKEAQLV